MIIKQHAFIKIKLSQSRYKKGYFYVSLVFDELQEIEAMDFRYFVDDGEVFTPTKIGFRVKKELFDLFLPGILKDSTGINIACCKDGNQELHIRHVIDSYGEGVDVRYFVSSDNYSGWSGKGVRFLVEDYKILQQEIQLFVDSGFNYLAGSDLFREKEININKGKVKKSNPEKIFKF